MRIVDQQKVKFGTKWTGQCFVRNVIGKCKDQRKEESKK